jgi:hypothetical protein
MSGNRTDRLTWLSLLLVASSLAGCSSPSLNDQPPTLREIRKQLAEGLKRQSLFLDDLHEDGDGRYTGKSERNVRGVIYVYRIEATVKGRWLRYTATPRTPLPDEENILGGTLPLPMLPFRERHAELMQWLRAVACVVQGLAVVWAMLGRFGYRRSYSPRLERILVISAAINLGFAIMWGYEFFTNLGST